MTDAAALCANLSECGGAKVGGVHGDCGRTFRAAVAFVRPEAEVILERLRNAVGQFLRARHHETQASEIFRRAAARVSVQEGWRGEQHGYRVFADERADHPRIERVGM